MESPPYMRCVLRLDTNSPGWHKTMIKVLTSVKGVSYTIDAIQGLAYVEGKIESDVILKIMEKAGQHAQLWRIDSRHQPSTSRDYLKIHGHGHGNVNGGNYAEIMDHHPHQQMNLNQHYPHHQPPSVPEPVQVADIVPDKKPTKCCMM